MRYVVWSGIVAVIIGLIGGLTPLVWVLEGRQSESYPEVFFLGAVLPLGLLLLALAGAMKVVRLKGRRS